MFVPAIGYALLSGLLYALYVVNIKKCGTDRIILFFWVNVLTYVAYLGLYFFKNIIIKHDLHPVQHLIHDFTLTNVPFYALMGFFWVGSLLILNHLLNKHELSIVIPITHIGILISTAGYILLGKQFTNGEIIGKCCIFLGALLSAYDHVSLKTLFKSLKKVPGVLLIAAVLDSLFVSGSQWMTFLCTSKTTITQEILDWAQDISHHIHGPSFGFHNPFYYNVGVRFFVVLIFLIYIIFFTNLKNKLFPTLYKKFGQILLISFFFAGFIISYHSAFLLFTDRSILVGISKLTVPATLIAGYWFLGEKITQPKIVGGTLIICGGLLNVIL